MKLIEWKDYKIHIAPEAYGIKVFREIWKRDRSRNKENAILALSVLYFMYDPRSEYQFETDEVKRLEIIKEQTGMRSNWQPNELFKEAIPVYKYLTNTTSSLMLASNRKILEKTREALEDFDLSEIDPDKQATAAANIFRTVASSTDLMVRIAKAEQEIYKDVEEHFKKRSGKGEMSIGDEGLSSLINLNKEF